MDTVNNAALNTAYNSPAYRRSRNAYTAECAFEYFATLLVGDAFLAKLLDRIGLDDALIGVVSSLISLAFLFQLVSVFVVQRIVNTKRFVTLIHTVGQLFFSVLYLIPFMPFALPYRKVLVFACVLLAYFGNYFVTAMLYKWGNSFVDPDHRGRFSATKEMISLVGGMVMTLVIGYTMDAFEAADNLEGGFIFAAVAILIFTLADLVCLLLIKSDLDGERTAERQDVPQMREVVRNTLGSKDFRHVIVLTVLWNVARYTTIGFLGTYRISDLLFAVGTVQIINIIGNIGRVLLSRAFGAYTDKHTFAKGIELAMWLSAIAFAFQICTVPSTRWLIIGYSLFYNVSQAGIVANMNSIVYSYVDNRYFVQASAIKNSIGGVAGFLAALLGGRLLSLVQAGGNRLFGITVYGQQVLSAISLVLVLISILYSRLVIAKQSVMKQ